MTLSTETTPRNVADNVAETVCNDPQQVGLTSIATSTVPTNSSASAVPSSDVVVDRKVPLWAKLLVTLCILTFLGFFLAYASQISSGAMD